MGEAGIRVLEATDRRFEDAVKAYLGGEASLGGAAEMAGMSYCDFREALRSRGLLAKGIVALQ
jgi:predicted HTH domain antitoxin